MTMLKRVFWNLLEQGISLDQVHTPIFFPISSNRNSIIKVSDLFGIGNSEKAGTADSRTISRAISNLNHVTSKPTTSSNCCNSEQRIRERMTDKWLAEQHHQQHRTQKGEPLPRREISLVHHASILDQVTEIDPVGEAEPSDGGFSTWSDFSGPELELNKAFLDVLEPFRQNIVQTLMIKFLAGQQNIRAHAPSCREDATEASSQLPIVSNLENSNSSTSINLKRNHGRKARHDGEDDDEDNPQPSRKRVLRSPDDSPRQLLLACPFCKNNPRHYRRCFAAVLRDISRVK